MDKASDFESEDCEFESRRGRCSYVFETPNFKEAYNESSSIVMVDFQWF